MIGRRAKIKENVRKRVDILALQEVHFRNEEVKTLREGDLEYRLYWKGEDLASKGVELMVKFELVKSVMDARRISSRVLPVDLVLCGKVVTITLSIELRVVKVK